MGVAYDYLPDNREEQGHRVIGDFVYAIVGHVGHDDVALARRLEINVVDSDPVAGDHLALLQMFERAPVDGGVRVEQCIGIASVRSDGFNLGILQHDQLGTDVGQDLALDVRARKYLIGQDNLHRRLLGIEDGKDTEKSGGAWVERSTTTLRSRILLMPRLPRSRGRAGNDPT